MKSRIVAVLVVGLLATPLSARAASIVVNGGFETNDLTGWSCVNADLCSTGAFDPNTGLFAFQGYDNTGFGTLSQVLPTVAGATYAFDFYSRAYNADLGNILRYQIDGGAIQTVTTTTAHALTSTSFIAAGPATTISFLFETDDGTGIWVIDDVFVEQRSAAAVPEPASLTLLGLGLAGARARQWLRKRRTA